MTMPIALKDITIYPIVEQQGSFFKALEFFPNADSTSQRIEI